MIHRDSPRNFKEEAVRQVLDRYRDSSVVRQEGQRQVRRSVRFYNLDAVISVGITSIQGRARSFACEPTESLKTISCKALLSTRNGCNSAATNHAA